MADERETLVSHLSHDLERWFGPNIAGWPENPTKYFGTPAREAVERIYGAGVAEGIRQAQALVPVGIAEHGKMYDALMAINKLTWPHE